VLVTSIHRAIRGQPPSSRTRVLTRSGYESAAWRAMKAPIEWPTRTPRSIPSSRGPGSRLARARPTRSSRREVSQSLPAPKIQCRYPVPVPQVPRRRVERSVLGRDAVQGQNGLRSLPHTSERQPPVPRHATNLPRGSFHERRHYTRRPGCESARQHRTKGRVDSEQAASLQLRRCSRYASF